MELIPISPPAARPAVFMDRYIDSLISGCYYAALVS